MTLFTEKEQELIDYYLDMTDAIITEFEIIYKLETPETIAFLTKNQLINEIEYNVNEIRKAVKND